MNTADSERLSSTLDSLGYEEVSSPNIADVVVLNSCVVRQSSEDKVVGMLTSLKPIKRNDRNPVIALMGCMVGPKTDQLSKRFPYVDVFMRPQQYDPLLNLLKDRNGTEIEGCLGNLQPVKPKISTYIPVTHGCNEFCSFCIIPYRRGKQLSRTIEEIVNEINLLVSRGVKEITLLGQTVDAYGHDLKNKQDLSNLLREVNTINGLERIRFLTSHPKYMTEQIIDSIGSLDKVCEHINLPFQAGSNSVLENMRRGYTQEEYKDLVRKIRSKIPNVAMSTDIIVGFPGETDRKFSETLKILQELRFDKVHLAAYSSRPGTIAQRKMTDDVTIEDKKSRIRTVELLQETIATEINAAIIGKSVEILVEGKYKDRWFGRTRGNKLVYFEGQSDFTGDILNIEVNKTTPWSLQGKVLSGI